MADPYQKDIPITGMPRWEKEFRSKFTSKNGIITTKDGVQVSKSQWKKMFVKARTEAEKSRKFWSTDRNQGVNPKHWWKSPAIINRMLNSTEIDPDNPERYLNVHEYNKLVKERKVEDWQIFASQLKANQFNKSEASKNKLRVFKVNQLVKEGVDRKEALMIVGGDLKRSNVKVKPASKGDGITTEVTPNTDTSISTTEVTPNTENSVTQTASGEVLPTTAYNKNVKQKAIANPEWKDIEWAHYLAKKRDIKNAKDFMERARNINTAYAGLDPHMKQKYLNNPITQLELEA